MRCATLTAVMIGFFSLNSYSAEIQSEIYFLDGLNSIQQAIKEGPEDSLPVPPVPARAGRDVTGNFRAAWESCGLTLAETQIAELRKYQVILVPGFLSNAGTRPVSIFGKRVLLGKYFSDQMKTLSELGVDYKLADIESEQTLAFNAAIIAQDIEASGKPVILMGHSKGGLDIIETLITRKQLLPKVRGIITIQTPYFGSPVADYVLQRRIFRELAARLLESLGGTLGSLISLDTRQREAYYRENRDAIDKVINTVPVITVGSWQENVGNRLDTILEPLRNEMLKMGLKNDGVVPLSSAILPGTDYVEIRGVDHLAVVMDTSPVLGYDRARLTKALLLMLLSK